MGEMRRDESSVQSEKVTTAKGTQKSMKRKCEFWSLLNGTNPNLSRKRTAVPHGERRSSGKRWLKDSREFKKSANHQVEDDWGEWWTGTGNGWMKPKKVRIGDLTNERNNCRIRGEGWRPNVRQHPIWSCQKHKNPRSSKQIKLDGETSAKDRLIWKRKNRKPNKLDTTLDCAHQATR